MGQQALRTVHGSTLSDGGRVMSILSIFGIELKKLLNLVYPVRDCLRDCLVNNLLIYNEKNLKIHDHLPPCNFIWKFKYGFSR